jgi:hypothetical protein
LFPISASRGASKPRRSAVPRSCFREVCFGSLATSLNLTGEKCTLRNVPPKEEQCQEKTTKGRGFLISNYNILCNRHTRQSASRPEKTGFSRRSIPLFTILRDKVECKGQSNLDGRGKGGLSFDPMEPPSPIGMVSLNAVKISSAWELDFQVRPGESLDKFCFHGLSCDAPGNGNFIYQQLPGPIEHFLLTE